MASHALHECISSVFRNVRPGPTLGLVKPETSTTPALVGLSLSMLLAALGTSIGNVALPAIATAFDATLPQVQGVTVAYLVAVTSVIAGAGRLGDIVGRRRLLVAGIAMFTLAAALGGVAPSLACLVAARAVQGAGAAVMMALSIAFVGQAVAKEEAGRAMGLLGSMSAIGTATGPSLGGVLLDSLGWRAVFLASVPLGVVALLLAGRHLPADRLPSIRQTFDTQGTLLLALTTGAYALTMTVGGGRIGLPNVGLLAITAIGGTLFVQAERRAPSPLIELATLRGPLLARLGMSALVATVIMATLVVGPFYLSQSFGLGPAALGLVMSVGPVVAAITGVPAGRLTDRFGAGRTTRGGLVAMAAGAFALSVSPAGLPGYVLSVVVLTGGYAVFQTANNTAVLTGFGAERRGAVSGLLSLSRNLGLVTGASVMAAVYAMASGTDLPHPGGEAVAGGLRATFAVGTALVVAALGMSPGTWRRPVRAATGATG